MYFTKDAIGVCWMCVGQFDPIIWMIPLTVIPLKGAHCGIESECFDRQGTDNNIEISENKNEIKNEISCTGKLALTRL